MILEVIFQLRECKEKEAIMPTVHYLWDVLDDNILEELDDAGNAIVKYTHEPGLHGQLISHHRNGQTYYHHYDGVGNTCAVTDQTGNIVESATYSAFGEVVEKTSSIVNPFGYKGALGYYTDSETGDLNVRARPYRPVIARWLAADLIELFDGTSRYLYTSNNPINRADPSGRNWTVLVENITYGAQCQADYQVSLGFIFEEKNLPANPTPEQVWATNKVSGSYMDEKCKWHELVFTTITIDRKTGKVTTVSSTEKTIVDVWGKQTISKVQGVWTFDDTSTGLAVGGGTPRCIVALRTDKTLGFNSAQGGKNFLLPEQTSVALHTLTPAQQQQLQQMRGPTGGSRRHISS